MAFKIRHQVGKLQLNTITLFTFLNNYATKYYKKLN